jgi:hypothetical protein
MNRRYKNKELVKALRVMIRQGWTKQSLAHWVNFSFRENYSSLQEAYQLVVKASH